MSLGIFGATKLSIETVPPIITRGVLADIACYRGVRSLKPGEVITVTDLEGALRAQDVAVAPGDVLLFHTGWGALWDEDPARYTSGEPVWACAARPDSWEGRAASRSSRSSSRCPLADRWCVWEFRRLPIVG